MVVGYHSVRTHSRRSALRGRGPLVTASRDLWKLHNLRIAVPLTFKNLNIGTATDQPTETHEHGTIGEACVFVGGEVRLVCGDFLLNYFFSLIFVCGESLNNFEF